MPTAADLEARAIWQLVQAGYAVIIEVDHHYIVTKDTGGVIATPASLASYGRWPTRSTSPCGWAIDGWMRRSWFRR